ncbi:hypothetical protein [Aureimonas sp. AU20]|nr:hypothetical protein [Aureimonas sp. AU20]ALN71114.1 hypothetical protein M673_00235 [Aureimonas sp. AU20]
MDSLLLESSCAIEVPAEEVCLTYAYLPDPDGNLVEVSRYREG